MLDYEEALVNHCSALTIAPTTKLVNKKPPTVISANKAKRVKRASASRSSKHRAEAKQDSIRTSRTNTKTVKRGPAEHLSEDIIMQDNPEPPIDIPNLRFLRRVRRQADFGAKKEKRKVVKDSENWFATDMELLGIVWDYAVECDRPVGFPLDRMSFLQ
ncbi:unnamed protein product [Fusarium equiseti]|uniref:Uncharacterized protein n=1 Tax=Fusarium equiseti TaxID=61235 RepID=A0A8J2IWZ1_FUSEQ|nr:unnamed protein product [Fusarium equiseti]